MAYETSALAIFAGTLDPQSFPDFDICKKSTARAQIWLEGVWSGKVPCLYKSCSIHIKAWLYINSLSLRKQMATQLVNYWYFIKSIRYNLKSGAIPCAHTQVQTI